MILLHTEYITQSSKCTLRFYELQKKKVYFCNYFVTNAGNAALCFDADIKSSQFPPALSGTHQAGQMIIEPERLHQQAVHPAHLLLCGAHVVLSAAGAGLPPFLPHQPDQIRLASDRLLKFRIGQAYAVRLVGIAAAESGLVVSGSDLDRKSVV